MQYNKVFEKDIVHIKSIINDENRVFHGENINEDYSHDELAFIKSKPELVIKVKSTEEVSEIMKYAYEKNIPVTARGSGTGLVGACVPLKGGIIIDLIGII